jgi:hypothetical protein
MAPVEAPDTALSPFGEQQRAGERAVAAEVNAARRGTELGEGVGEGRSHQSPQDGAIHPLASRLRLEGSARFTQRSQVNDRWTTSALMFDHHAVDDL